MKEIVIDGETYKINCTAYTRFQYKKFFGVGIFEDISKINNFNALSLSKREELKKEGKSDKEIEIIIQNLMMERLDDFMDVIQRLAYIEILTANPSFVTYEQWLSGINQISLADPWISEVTELAVNSFCGQGTDTGTEEIAKG